MVRAERREGSHPATNAIFAIIRSNDYFAQRSSAWAVSPVGVFRFLLAALPEICGIRNRVWELVRDVRDTHVAHLSFGEGGLESSANGPCSHAHSARDLPPNHPPALRYDDSVDSHVRRPEASAGRTAKT